MSADSGEVVNKVAGMIELRVAEFRYLARSEVVIFRDFNLKMKAGESMALVEWCARAGSQVWEEYCSGIDSEIL